MTTKRTGKKQYELRRSDGTLVGAYDKLLSLRVAWRKYSGEAALVAYHLVGDSRIDISNEMPTVAHTLREFRTAEERDAHIIKEAKYFTIVAFLGVGRYDRHERPTAEEAISLGNQLAKANNKHYLVYAVNERENTAYVTTCKG